MVTFLWPAYGETHQHYIWVGIGALKLDGNAINGLAETQLLC